jgi:hypothetical protein
MWERKGPRCCIIMTVSVLSVNSNVEFSEQRLFAQSVSDLEISQNLRWVNRCLENLHDFVHSQLWTCPSKVIMVYWIWMIDSFVKRRQKRWFIFLNRTLERPALHSLVFFGLFINGNMNFFIWSCSFSTDEWMCDLWLPLVFICLVICFQMFSSQSSISM